ncbi:MAG: NUDIX hydrolase [Acidimicrobiales bacterium]
MGERVLRRGWAISMVEAVFEDPEGNLFTRDVIRHPGAVAVVAITGSSSVVLVEQYRPALDRWILEIPAGTADVTGEGAEETAKRELAEEAGLAASRIEPLARCALTPGFCDQYSTIFLATDLRAVPTHRMGPEERHLRSTEVPLSEFDARVDGGSIIDASTILGVSLARRRLQSRAHVDGRP